jgi:hypothetical protein
MGLPHRGDDGLDGTTVQTFAACEVLPHEGTRAYLRPRLLFGDTLDSRLPAAPLRVGHSSTDHPMGCARAVLLVFYVQH